MDNLLLTTIGVVGSNVVVTYYMLDGTLTTIQKAVVFWVVMLGYALVALPRAGMTPDYNGYTESGAGYLPDYTPAPATQSGYTPGATMPATVPYAPAPMQQPAMMTQPAPPVGGQQAIERDAIERVIFRSTLPFYVNSVTDTPDYTYYMMDRIPNFPTHVQWSEIRGITNEIATEIYRTRSAPGGVTATFNEQPPYIRVTAPTRRVLPWSARGGGKSHAPMFTALLGMVWTHGRPALTAVNLLDQKECHIGVFSSSGGGKSVLLHIIALSLLENADPNQVELYFIDLDSDQFDVYRSLPHVRMVAGTDEEALALLRHLVNGMDRTVRDGKRKILIVDELQMLTVDSDHADDFVDLIGQLGQRWRKRGGNLVLATQDPSGNNFPKAVQRNIKVTVAGFTEDDEYLSRYLNVPGASKLRGDGDFLIRKNGQVVNFKSFWLKEEDKLATITAIKQRWGEDASNNLRLDLSDDGGAAEADDQADYGEDDDYLEDDDGDNGQRPARTPVGLPTSVGRIGKPATRPANVLPRPLTGKEKKLDALAKRLIPILDEVWDADNEQWIDRPAAFDAIFGKGNWHSNTHYTKKAKEVVQYAVAVDA